MPTNSRAYKELMMSFSPDSISRIELDDIRACIMGKTYHVLATDSGDIKLNLED